MSILPEGWKRVRIGALCKLENGRAFKPSDWNENGLPIVRIQNLNNPDAPYNKYEGEVRSRFLIDSGQLLFAWSGTPGTSFGAHIWNGGKAVLNQHIFKVVFDERLLDKGFFRLAINQKLDELIGKAHGGVGLQHVTKGRFEDTEIDLPPLVDQRQIIAKLDMLVARSSRVHDELSRIPKLAARAKQAAITAATMDESGEQWPRVPLGSLISDGPTNGYSPRSGDNPSGTLSLKLTATTRGALNLDDRSVKRLNEIIPVSSKFWLRPGDILIQRANSLEYVGITAIYDGPENTYIYPDLMIRVRVKSRILGRWLWRYLNSEEARQHFMSNATGTAGNMPKINGTTVRQIPIPMPPDHLLNECIDRLEHQIDAFDKMRLEAAHATDLVASLNEAILAKAFRGELGRLGGTMPLAAVAAE
jgi:restriction endonuclease S subunit